MPYKAQEKTEQLFLAKNISAPKVTYGQRLMKQLMSMLKLMAFVQICSVSEFKNQIEKKSFHI